MYTNLHNFSTGSGVPHGLTVAGPYGVGYQVVPMDSGVSFAPPVERKGPSTPKDSGPAYRAAPERFNFTSNKR